MKTDRREFLGQALYLGAAMAMPLGRLETLSSPFPELKASGSPGAMGLAHGKTFAAQVKHNVGFYLDYLAKRNLSEKEEILSCAHGFTGVISTHFPELFEEMEGIAKGARCDIDEILAVNARSDLLVLGKKTRKGQKPQKPSRDKPGCTALALMEKMRGRSLIALGQNWDWNRALRKNSVILRLKPTHGRQIVTFTEAGMLGKIGFNDRRLGVCLNFLSHRSDDPEAEPGVPVHCLLRAVMGCDSLEGAAKLVEDVPRCASANFLMAQAVENGGDNESVALNLEWAPRSVGRLLMKDGIQVHTNHFKDGILGGTVKTGNSYQRDVRAEKMAVELRGETREPAERMMQILSRGDRDPVALSRGSSQAGIVMDLSRNRLHVCFGPPHMGSWVPRPGV